MYEQVCYKKPFLKDVILRLDFGAPVAALSRAVPQKIATLALQRFPIAEQQKGKSHGVVISDAAIETTQQEIVQWLYHGRNREKTLSITASALFLSHRAYESYEALKNDINPVIDAVFDLQKDLVIARIGLRYINVLETDKLNPLSWEGYIRNDLLGSINAFGDTGTLSRAFQIIEFNDDGRQTKLQLGIANPDFPAPIKRNQFVIDIDSSYQGALGGPEVKDAIEIAHSKIQDLFETIITQTTRDLMEQVLDGH